MLLLFHPRNFSDQLQFIIDQYILNGGSAIVFVDPFSTVDPTPGSVKASSLDRLFNAWGVTMHKDKTVADLKYSTKIRNRAEQIEDNPFWLNLHSVALNTDHIITAKLESILMPMAGAISKAKDSPYEYEPLLQSSVEAALEDSFRVRMTANEIRSTFKAAGNRFDLAAKVSGIFNTAFPDGKPKDPAADQKKDKNSKAEGMAKPQTVALKKGVKPATIIIVTDSDMLFDGYYVIKQKLLGFEVARIFNDNLNFALNSIEMLSGGEELISIRSRGKFGKPFIRVLELEKKAQVKWLAREQELIRKVEDTNQKLAQLEQQKDASQKLIISKEQEEEIQKFQEEKLRIKKELKIVRRNLRADIEALGVAVKAINIFLVPLLVCIVGVVYAVYKRKKSLI
ncbi:Gldg family protein [Thermodesulfobacteriota bacterium]